MKAERINKDGQLWQIKHHKEGKRILIQMSYLYSIGGIETACETIARTFKDKNICFVINALADGAMEQIERLGKYQDVIIDRDRNMKHEADVALIFTPIMVSVPFDTIEAPKIYQFIHSDIKGYMSYPQFSNFKWTPNSKVTKVLSVSDTAQRGLKEALGIDSEIVPNIFNPGQDRVVFLYMGRSSAEKGLDKALELARRFDRAGKDYIMLICSLVDPYGPYWPEIEGNKRIKYLGYSIYNDIFYKCATYLIQLSAQESWCYSIREALRNKCAVIGSKIPEIEKVIKDGVNGYLLDDDLSNLDIDKIFNNIPKVDGYSEPIPEIWTDVLEGKL